MKSHLYLVYIILPVIAKKASATVLPVGAIALVDASTDSYAKSSSANGGTNERRGQRVNTSRCSTICGTPVLADCNDLLLDQAQNPNSICAAPLNDVGVAIGSCGLAYVNPIDNGQKCVSSTEFQKAAKQLVSDCAKGMHFGGCFELSDGTFICNFNTESSCKPRL
jgi:hypothetical protein